jgi:hypothetical protein
LFGGQPTAVTRAPIRRYRVGDDFVDGHRLTLAEEIGQAVWFEVAAER